MPRKAINVFTQLEAAQVAASSRHRRPRGSCRHLMTRDHGTAMRQTNAKPPITQCRRSVICVGPNLGLHIRFGINNINIRRTIKINSISISISIISIIVVVQQNPIYSHSSKHTTLWGRLGFRVSGLSKFSLWMLLAQFTMMKRGLRAMKPQSRTQNKVAKPLPSSPPQDKNPHHF